MNEATESIASHHASANLRGALWVLASTALFTVIFASARFAGPALAIPQILVWRYVGALVTIGATAAASGQTLVSLRSAQPGQHFLRACFGCSGGLAAVYAAAHMPISAASAIGLLDGVIIVALAIALLGEIVGWRHWLAGLTCAVGALGVVWFQHSPSVPGDNILFPAAMAFLGAVLMAVEAIYIKRLTQSDKPLSILAYVNFFALFLMLGPALWSWQPMSLSEIGACLLLGPAAILGQYCTIRGYRLADMAVAGPVGYSWILFAALLGFLAFGEVPDIRAMFGCLLMLAGGYWLTRLPRTGVGG